jgi:hypothetical protein
LVALDVTLEAIVPGSTIETIVLATTGVSPIVVRAASASPRHMQPKALTMPLLEGGAGEVMPMRMRVLCAFGIKMARSASRDGHVRTAKRVYLMGWNALLP